MSKNVWLSLNSQEKALLLGALSSARASAQGASDVFDALARKLAGARPYPQITVGIERGFVWMTGNPFPIRVCDYDIEGEESPDVDERGNPCCTWLEPPDPDTH